LDRKTLILLFVALLLGALVYYDNHDWRSEEDSMNAAAPAAQETDVADGERFRRQILDYQRVLGAKEEINDTYNSLAFSYAVAMADLETFVESDTLEPKAIAGKAVKELLRGLAGVTVKRLTLGTPRAQGEGVFTVSVAVELEVLNHQGAIGSLIALGQPAKGLLWETFDLRAYPDERKINLSGKLLAVVVKAAE